MLVRRRYLQLGGYSSKESIMLKELSPLQDLKFYTRNTKKHLPAPELPIWSAVMLGETITATSVVMY